MPFFDRFSTSLRAGIQAWSSYNQDALVPITAHQWDALSSRLFRYEHCRHYYFNTIYNEDHAAYSAQHLKKSNHGLYRHTRPIYNPVARGVDMYPAKVYGGQLDLEELTGGAIPLKGIDDRQREAIKQLWIWSDWQTNKSQFVQTGAMNGDTFIKVVDEPDKGRVRMEICIPDIFSDIDFDSVGNITRCVIEYQKYDKDGTPYRYKEVITKEEFATFKNDQPFAYMTDRNNESQSSWPNIYGFVPVVHVKHKGVPGARFGMSAAHKVIFKVDEMNSSGSAMNDNIRKVVNPIWAAIGLTGNIESTVDDTKGKLPILGIPDGVDMKPLVMPIDLAAAGQNLDRMQSEIERDMPELALHRLREGGNLTAPGVRAGYSDAIDLINEAMGHYDSGQVRAVQMSMTIGGIRGYKNFSGFDLGSYDRGDLAFHIGHREVIDDTLSKFERTTFLINVQAPKTLVYKELEISDDDVIAAQAEDEKIAERQMQLEIAKSANARADALALGGEAAARTNNGRQSPANGRPGQQPAIEQPATATAAAAV